MTQGVPRMAGKNDDKTKIKAAKQKKQKPKRKKGVPNFDQMGRSTKRIIWGFVLLFVSVGAYTGLFFVPKFPNYIWLRVMLAAVFAALLATAFFLLIKKRLTAKDLQFIEDEENVARAIRALKLAKFYTKKFPGFPHGVRKEIFPAILVGLILFPVFCLVSPCRPPEAPLPDFSRMTAQDFYYPFLFAASDSQAILAPPMLSIETEEWADKIPPKYLEMMMYAEIFRNRFEAGYAIGNLYDQKTAGVLTAMAQASMLLGEYSRAVSEYDEALQKNQPPEIVFQKGIALAYAGRLKESAEVLDSLDPKAVKDALNDDFALPHWKLAVKILQGDLTQETLDNYRKFEELAKRAVKTSSPQPEAGKSETAQVVGKTDSAKADSGKANTAKAPQKSRKSEAAELKAQAEALAAQRLQERRVMSTGNNAAVLQLLAGKYANAIPTANSVLLQSRGKEARRTAKIIQMCAINTKGYAVGNLKSAEEDRVKELSSDVVFDTAAGYFTKVRSLYEEALAFEHEDSQTANPAFKKTPYFLLPWVAELNFTLTDQFTSKDFPDSKSMQENYADLLALCEAQHKSWSLADVSRVPAYAVPVENLLMRTSLILDGQDRDEYSKLALKVCGSKLQKDNSLPLLTTLTLRMELNLLGRFGANEALAIKMYQQLSEEQRKTQKASIFLPENHPLLGRQELTAMRLTLIHKDLTTKDFKVVNAALARAAEILEPLKLPAENWIMQELAESQRLGNALKKKESSEIQAIFTPEINKLAGNHFRQSWVYRDLAFALQHRNFIAEADSANRSARAIFNQEIYRNNTQHFLILQIDKMLKH